jgi:hypothetical protein
MTEVPFTEVGIALNNSGCPPLLPKLKCPASATVGQRTEGIDDLGVGWAGQARHVIRPGEGDGQPHGETTRNEVPGRSRCVWLVITMHPWVAPSLDYEEENSGSDVATSAAKPSSRSEHHCKSAVSPSRRRGAMPLLPAGRPRVWDSTERLTSQRSWSRVGRARDVRRRGVEVDQVMHALKDAAGRYRARVVPASLLRLAGQATLS